MENYKQIEEWIEVIESSNLTIKEQQQRIANLIDLWKFASCHEDSLKIADLPNLLLNSEKDTFEIINVQCKNLYIDTDKNATKKMFAEIESELNREFQRYGGIYRFEMKKLERNVNQKMLQEIKKEIIAAIKGEVILYRYVAKMNKIPAEDVKIVASNFNILEVTNIQILNELKEQSFNLGISATKKWMVFFLDNVENKCDYFYFEEVEIFSDFDSVFLFDFYNGETIEIQSLQIALKNN